MTTSSICRITCRAGIRRCPCRQRAAQFMPFAALTGYERVIEQAACDAEAAVARADAAGDTDFGA